VMDANHTLSAVYQTPACTGVAVYPGVDSLKNAVASWPAGSTFCLKAGVHRMTSRVLARTNDKYIGETGAILNGSKVLTSFVQVGSYWVASGQTQQETPFPATVTGGWSECVATAPACIYPEMVFLDGKDLWQVTSLAALTPGSFYFDYAGNQIYLADNPTGHLVEATTGSGGIIGYTGGTSNSVTVQNLVFEKFGGGEVTGYEHNALKAVTGWLVENNEFRLISFMAVANFGNGIVRNNYIHHNGRYGVVGSGTFLGNVISYNNTHGWATGTDAGSAKFHGTIGLVLKGNIVSNNMSRGLWTDFDNINVTYENNVIENNYQMGILHEVGCAAVIRYNVLRGNNYAFPGKSISSGGQIFTRSSKDVQIYGNDVTALLPGVNGIGVYSDSVNGVLQSYTGTNCGTISLQNIQVHDNVVRLDTGQQHGNIGGGSAYGIAFSNNTYYLRDLTAKYFYYQGGTWDKNQFQAAGADVTGKFYQWVGGYPASTTTTLASSRNPSSTGASVTFTATVTGSAPSGSVAFNADGTTIGGCAAVALPAGTANSKTATCATTSLSAGTHSIKASYMGDATNGGSTSATLSQVVSTKIASTTAVASSVSPSTVGVNVTFTATVTASAPTGSVAFTADGTTLSGCGAVALPSGTANSKTATCSTASLIAGIHSIVATYSGDTANNGSSSAALSQVVNSTTTVWVNDALPSGAQAVASTDGWNWVSSSPTPYSGTRAHQSALLSGLHQHTFTGATATLNVAVGDSLFAYVYLDPANPPSEVMLQWNDGTWEHRAYWGANLIGFGTD
jgi:hypothetical protein